MLYALAHAPVYAPAAGALEPRNVEGQLRRGVRGMFLNETIRADFLIKRLNKKIEGNCLNKPPLSRLCDGWVPMRGTVTIYVSA